VIAGIYLQEISKGLHFSAPLTVDTSIYYPEWREVASQACSTPPVDGALAFQLVCQREPRVAASAKLARFLVRPQIQMTRL
jgi:hypothetical protein